MICVCHICETCAPTQTRYMSGIRVTNLYHMSAICVTALQCVRGMTHSYE